ncbi:hypothetical protein HXX76_014861 [Chlamydomonas incerta]|uniref:Uncharacterized protein n=1 Tax=Chlamydomonas incerta TaxID=51695 RepID=A0A835SIF4_CHLIN|nr:hypothetical protein HXX76_014861 [Chlamydomonas incerta]|eukprot:KAG2424038.1 hypothetical protein HXX76_014861 [Chlamydomonas incerta]
MGGDVFAKAFAGGGPRKNVREENNQRDRVSAVRTAFGAERFDSLVAAAKQRPGTARYPHVAERLRAVADGGHSTSIRLWQVAPGASEMEKAALYQTLNQAGRDLAAVHSGAAAVAVTTGIEMYSALTVGNNCAVDAMATLRSTLDARRCAMEGSGQVFDGFMDPTVEAVGRAGAEPSPDGVSDALSVALEDMRQQLVKEAVCCLDVSPAVVQRLTGLAHMDVSDLVSALQAPLPPPHPGEDASAAVKEAYQAQAKCRELHQSLFGVMAASRHVPIALYSGTQDGDGVVTVQAQLFTGGQQLVGRRWGAQVQAPGAGAGSSSSSAAAQEAEGMSQGVDALDMLCVANWAGHYYAAVPASAINILLPSAEDLASVGASGGCTADSGLKQLGRPFNMAMLPSHQRQLLEEVSASAYVNEGRVVPLAARSVTPAAVRAGFLDDVDLRLSCEDLAAICGSGEEGWIPSILGHNCRSPAREEGTMRSRGTKIAASGGGFSALADCDPGDVPPERQVYEKQRSGKGTAQRGAPQPQRGQGASSGVEKSRKRTGSLRGAGAASTGSPVVSAGKRQRHCERQHEGDTATANNESLAVGLTTMAAMHPQVVMSNIAWAATQATHVTTS